MQGFLVMRSADLEPEYIQTLTRELSLTLNRETDVRAQPAGGPAEPGTKGDPITLGSLALTFLTSGAAVALIKVLETYVGRKRSLEVELARPDGKKLVIKSQDLAAGQIQETENLVSRFFRGV